MGKFGSLEVWDFGRVEAGAKVPWWLAPKWRPPRSVEEPMARLLGFIYLPREEDVSCWRVEA